MRSNRNCRPAGVSFLALATGLAMASAASPVAAQSLEGTPTVTFGSANISEGAGTTQVDVLSQSAVIDWVPDDNAIANGAPIVFQQAGTTATFNGVNGDFALLNRIAPADITRAILMDGTTISQFQDISGSVTGGTVFFYSPSGFIIGANAVFNVGNLGLTSSPPAVDGNGFWNLGDQVVFGQAPNSASRIEIRPGAQINALQEGSYVATWSPFLNQQGTVTVNGQAAYVAAEAGLITFSPDGLFRIQVDVGTDGLLGGTSIIHDGTTTGPASSGAGDNHRIYLVSAPKNNLLTMAISRGSNLGFDIAAAADVQGNAVVLSAGYNIQNGIHGAPAGTAGASIIINDSVTPGAGTVDFTSAVSSKATSDTTIDVFNGTNFASDATFQSRNLTQLAVNSAPNFPNPGALTVGGNLTLSADNFEFLTGNDAGRARLIVDNGGTATVAGNLTISANTAFDADGDGTATAGTSLAEITNGAALSVGGQMLINSSAFTNSALPPVDAQGGGSQLFVSGSTLNVNGVLRAYAGGIAGTNTGATGQGADGRGGSTSLFLTNGAQVTVLELNAAADGVGGVDIGAGAGSGLGGSASVSVNGAGTVFTVLSGNNTGNFNTGELDMVSAEGFGGATSIAGSTAGTGRGGAAQINVSGGANFILPDGATGALGVLTVYSSGIGGAALGEGTTGGAGFGGATNLFVDAANFAAESLVLGAAGIGGDSAGGFNANGGTGTGGSRQIAFTNGATVAGSLLGGRAGGVGGNGSGTGAGGDGVGGTSDFLMIGSSLDITTTFRLNGGSLAGIGQTVGDAVAGTHTVTISSSTVTGQPDATFILGASASTRAGVTFPPGEGVLASGSVTGGVAAMTVDGSNINVDNIEILAAAIAADAGVTGLDLGPVTGGDSTGGQASLYLRNSDITAMAVFIDSGADSGFIDGLGFGTGGNATGGLSQVIADVGTSTVNADIVIDSDGFGTTVAEGPGLGGNGTGGNTFLAVNGGADLTITGFVELDSDANGGSVFGGGSGGTAVLGTANVEAGVGSLTVSGDLELEANGEGGDASGIGNAGGAASGSNGRAAVLAAGGDITVTGLTIIDASAFGGAGTDGADGGVGQAGTATARSLTNPFSPSSLTLQDVVITAIGTGGAGGDNVAGVGGAGGLGLGGLAQILGNAGNGQTTVNGSVIAEANGIGGIGGSGTSGGDGGAAFGGLVDTGVSSGVAAGGNTGSATFNQFLLQANATGGDGGTGTTGAGGNGGTATGGRTSLIARGATVDAGANPQLRAIALGGNGGAGTTQGAGGDAIVGEVAIGSVERFNVPTDRGNLIAGDIDAQAIATGGTGSTNGRSLIGNSTSSIELNNGDLTANSISLVVSAADATGAVNPDRIVMTNGVATVTNTLSFVTANDLLVSLDNATLNAGNIILDAASLLAPTTLPTILGTINSASDVTLITDPGGDLGLAANIQSANPIALSADGDVTTGSLTSAGDVSVVSATGSVTTGDVSGQVVTMAGPTGVSAGNITAQSVDLQSAGAVGAGSISANSISVDGGGLVSVLGGWTAGGISIFAGDIAIDTAAGGIDVGPTGALQLVSTNAAGAFIGDNTGGTGFNLGSAEFARISGNQILIGSADNPANAVDMTIGDLNIDGSQLLGVNPSVEFATGDPLTFTASGRIRVNGSVQATNLQLSQSIEFYADSFELNAETGSISATAPGSTNLGGTVLIEAANIHVASDAILTRLRTDPRYNGVATDLNTPGAVSNPDGVLSASALLFYPSDTLYIQNTGTAGVPAGFLTTIENSDIEPPGFLDPAAPDVDVIINGQFVTAAGTVTGQDAYDLVVNNAQSLDGFSAGSQVNACSLASGACTVIAPVVTPIAVIATEFTALQNAELEEEPFEVLEEDKEEDDADEGADASAAVTAATAAAALENRARSPIRRVPVVIDSRSINQQVEVADPVTGTGNPAFVAPGAPSVSSQADEGGVQ